MLDTSHPRAVHYPQNPDKFQFDSEVANIFDDMAVRSIPNFLEAHAAHSVMLRPWLKHSGCSVLDVGASRGAFFRAIIEVAGMHRITAGHLKLKAIDNSSAMVARMAEEFPYVQVENQDITSLAFQQDPECYDVVCVNYVLQFLPIPLQMQALDALLRKVRSGGVLILGHKSKSPGESGEVAHEQYIQWRMNNGYSREEIEAKTKALSNSMFPMDHRKVVEHLWTKCSEVTETFRFMMFSTLFAVK